jgi:hypothetical protein
MCRKEGVGGGGRDLEVGGWTDWESFEKAVRCL